MKEMITPYRHTPSARPTKIRDLPRTLESSLIATRAALDALATAIPPPMQERPVTRAAAMNTSKEHDLCYKEGSKVRKNIEGKCTFITSFIFFSEQVISEWNENA